MPEDDPDGRNM